jgi:hypothetical protein
MVAERCARAVKKALDHHLNVDGGGDALAAAGYREVERVERERAEWIPAAKEGVRGGVLDSQYRAPYGTTSPYA